MAIDHQNITILVVDDDPIFPSIIPNMLKAPSFKDKAFGEITVMTANDSSEAVSTLRGQSNNIDIVITDYHMPGLNGVQLKKRISEEFGNLPVIVTSADKSSEIEQETLSSGAMCFMKKPIKPNDINTIYKHAFNHKMNDGSKKIQKKNSTDDDIPCDEDSRPHATKKVKIRWTRTLENLFFKAIQHYGVRKAVPKKILEYMNVKYLTRAHVASKLQKYRIFLKRVKEEGIESSRQVTNSNFSSYSNPQHSYDYNTSLSNNNHFNSQLGYGLGQTSLNMNNNALHDSVHQMNRGPTYDLSQTGSNLLPMRSSLGIHNGNLPTNEANRSFFGTSQEYQAQYGTTSNVLGMNSYLSNYAGFKINEKGDLVGLGGTSVNVDGNSSLGGIEVHGNDNEFFGGIKIHGNGNNESFGGIGVHGNDNGSFGGIRVHGNGNNESFGGIGVHGNGNDNGSFGGIRVHGDGNGNESFGGIRVHGDGNGNESFGGVRVHGNGNGNESFDGIRVHGNGNGSFGEIRVHGNGNGSFGEIKVHGNGNNESFGGIGVHGNDNGSFGGIRVHSNGNGSFGEIGVHGNGNGNGNDNGFFGGIRVHGDDNGNGSFGGVTVHGNGNGNGNGSFDEIRVHGNGNGSFGEIRVHGDGDNDGNGSFGENVGVMNWNFNNNNMSNHESSTSSDSEFPYGLSSYLDSDDNQTHDNFIAQTDDVVPALENPIILNDHISTNETFCDTLISQFDENQQHQENVLGENLGVYTDDNLQRNESLAAYPLEDNSAWSFNNGNYNDETLNSIVANLEMHLPTQDMNITNQEHGVDDLTELPSSFDKGWDDDDFMKYLVD